MHVNILNNFTDNCQKLEAVKTFFNRWMDKQTVVQSSNGMLFSNRKKWSIKQQKDTDDSSMHIAMSETSVGKAKCYKIPITWHSGKGTITYRDSYKDQWLPGVNGEKEIIEHMKHRGCSRVRKPPYITVIVNSCHFTSVKIHQNLPYKYWTLMYAN